MKIFAGIGWPALPGYTKPAAATFEKNSRYGRNISHMRKLHRQACEVVAFQVLRVKGSEMMSVSLGNLSLSKLNRWSVQTVGRSKKDRSGRPHRHISESRTSFFDNQVPGYWAELRLPDVNLGRTISGKFSKKIGIGRGAVGISHSCGLSADRYGAAGNLPDTFLFLKELVPGKAGGIAALSCFAQHPDVHAAACGCQRQEI